MSEIYLVRHGETVFNMKGRYQGQLDSPLTEYGVEQVSDVAHMFHVIVHDVSRMKVISGSLRRCCRLISLSGNKRFSLAKRDVGRRL